MPIIYGAVGAPGTSVDNSNQPILQGKQAEVLASEIHGKGYIAAYRGRLFSASAAAITVPVVVATVTSLFTLYNPPGSGVNAEMVEASVSQVIVTTVVNVHGWYFNTASVTAAGAFTTRGTVQSNLVGGQAGLVQFFSSYTCTATPTLIDVVANFGAVTNTNVGPPPKFYDGRLVLPPGIAMHFLASTAAGGTSGLTLTATWAEWPV